MSDSLCQLNITALDNLYQAIGTSSDQKSILHYLFFLVNDSSRVIKSFNSSFNTSSFNSKHILDSVYDVLRSEFETFSRYKLLSSTLVNRLSPPSVVAAQCVDRLSSLNEQYISLLNSFEKLSSSFLQLQPVSHSFISFISLSSLIRWSILFLTLISTLSVIYFTSPMLEVPSVLSFISMSFIYHSILTSHFCISFLSKKKLISFSFPSLTPLLMFFSSTFCLSSLLFVTFPYTSIINCFRNQSFLYYFNFSVDSTIPFLLQQG
ncbi:hypothetical protein GEMRC1_013832 [Eukaryota sp. GEM-RC1]